MGVRAWGVKLTAVMISVWALLVTPAFAQDDVRWDDGAIAELSLALREVWTHGLSPDDYADPERLDTLSAGAERDLDADAAFLALAHDLAFGRIDPRTIEPDWTMSVRDQDLNAALHTALESGEIYERLQALAPQNPDYQALRQDLIVRTAFRAQRIRVPDGRILKRGDHGHDVDLLRARLVQEGVLDETGPVGLAFDRRLESAVMRFQARHNLASDGEVGATTFTELNVDPRHRIDQLRANLERWRWLPQDLGRRHIRVNIADYRLEAWREGELERVHETMIGKLYSSTPIFSENMQYVELNPYWHTPPGLGAYWLRVMRQNPAYALSQGYQLVDVSRGRVVSPYEADWVNGRYRIQQRPGPTNAMGQAKFIFPNRHNVYIHDTPHRELFANVRRDDSSGCVRVQNPIDLAWWVLSEEPDWDRPRIDQVIASGETRRVYLSERLPVHILYFTAVPDRFGAVRFIHDVYSRDALLIAALKGEVIASDEDATDLVSQTQLLEAEGLNAAPDVLPDMPHADALDMGSED
ncbi:L,D-transpeptidase family protein [Woodsholea maritima]|uniref:L,D-transpeptidase family protein n=1 Tax=Woodsholea maritima TaxID=240237 RepID=UPI0003667887|nr:L,D-transpeptidase family protein [Woodsholea maritima]